MAEYRLSSCWRIAAPLDEVYRTIRDSGDWPDWWPSVERVVDLEKGDDSGVGRVQCHVWKGPLPYRLAFELKVMRIEPLCALEAAVHGEVEGTGAWTFSTDGAFTNVRHDWQVRTTRRWMNALAPFARPLFEWNHAAVMRLGERSLARRLGVEPETSRGVASETSRGPLSGPRAGVDVAAGLWAGFVAGIVATFAQMAVWWVTGESVFGTLLRDSSLAAAIVMGAGALAAPYGFDPLVMTVATGVHFALSLTYGCALGWAIRRLGRTASLLCGAAFGLAIYAVNLHGFTAWYPWFVQSRGIATLVAHLVFGLVAAIVYRAVRAVRARGVRPSGAQPT